MKDLKKLKKRLYSLASMGLVTCYTMATAYADNNAAPAQGGGASGASADTAMNSVITTAGQWIGKGALVVVLIGGIMFGLGIKNSDAEQKTNGVLTMVAGGVVAAICGALSKFGF
ncbi:MAG: hypothetical protein IKN85_13550 [Oscillospiraceae bacterium]|nr:hypothetical protein [Oscillospiraceae bacterium]MBR3536846.1 hypothetical protein [Oscillospiraceae bacterium]MBR6834474.1 hypothetical protein [Oscillospiraceae bacterium]MBR6923097.1 hypothetical protein [Oscillospiraceae bacterium]